MMRRVDRCKPISSRAGCAKRERGVVMIMALLIVALVTTIVVSVTWRFELSMARNENRWHGAQARAYLEAAEMLTCLGLQMDFALDPDPEHRSDHLGEDWAMPGTPFPVDEGWVRGDIEDAHSRINLNLLVDNPDWDPKKGKPLDRYSATQKRFVRLLQLIELEDGSFVDQDIAFGILEAIGDWIDQDNNVSGYNGAEAPHYESLDPPFVISNQEMATISELSMVKGVTPELYSKLLPYVSVLPGPKAIAIGGQPPAPAHLNINTMKPLLLRTLNKRDDLTPLAEEEWLSLLRARGGPIPGEEQQTQVEPMPIEGHTSVEDFAKLPEVKAILGEAGKDKDFDTKELVVDSRYFYLKTETLVGEQLRRGKALLYRDANAGGKTTVIRRTSANY